MHSGISSGAEVEQWGKISKQQKYICLMLTSRLYNEILKDIFLFSKSVNNILNLMWRKPQTDGQCHTKCIPGYVGMWSSSKEDGRLVKVSRRKDGKDGE